MCGIAGILRLDGQPAPAVGGAMQQALRLRGPDDSGEYADGPLLLCQTRLSILDLSPTGHQPMISADGRTVIVFNGEIYNFHDLRAELEARGVRFRGSSDTEVALEAWRAWGDAAWARFNGMFAMAVWDRDARVLHLSRDRFGIKPLFVLQVGPMLAFASEPKALRAAGLDLGVVDAQGLAEYVVYGTTLGTTTLYSNLRRLLPGHTLSVPAAGPVGRPRRYWLAAEVATPVSDVDEAAQRVRDLIVDAVQRQLVSDVPVGVFLSGGVDSTAVVAAAMPGGPRSRASRWFGDTYTVRFESDRNAADVLAARKVARHFGTQHHELEVGGYDVVQLLDTLLDAHDGPFGDAANLPLYLLSGALGGSPKVILQGDGGDELFGGYARYGWLAKLGLLAPAARVARPLLPLLPRPRLRARLDRLCAALGARDPAVRMGTLLTEDKPDAPATAALSATLRERLATQDPLLRYRELARLYADRDALQMMLLTDTSILLPDIFLEKVDRPTMAQSIEVRVPLLDHELADFVLGLPTSTKLPGGTTKGLFKRALAGLVPDFVMQRPKSGFGVPYGEWLRGPLAPVLRESLLSQPDWFDARCCQRLIDEHASGRRDHAFLLWKLLNLARWQARTGMAL